MANMKISEDALLAAGSIDGAVDYIPIVDPSEALADNRNKRSLLNSIADWVVQTATTFVQSGSGATPETVESALRDLRAGISTDTAYSRFYRSDNTFNGTVDHATFYGYNLTGFGQINDAAKSALMVTLEPDYNDGVTRVLEYHVDMAVPGGSFVRPYMATMAITGGDAGKITDTTIVSNININLQSQLVLVEAHSSYTAGAKLEMKSLDTGGKRWQFWSTGSTAGLGAGHFFLYNISDSRYGFICDHLGNVVLGNTAAIATNATNGFAYVPTCAGTPTGAPTAYTGRAPIIVDTTTHKLYFYSGGAWRDAGP